MAELHEVAQPFTTDSAAFNFNKKDASEVMFTIDVVRSLPAHAEPQHAHDQEQLRKGWTSELAGVLVNSHPFSYGCVVLVVRADRMLPQVLTQEAIELGLLLAAQSTEGLRVGYNSLAGTSLSRAHSLALSLSFQHLTELGQRRRRLCQSPALPGLVLQRHSRRTASGGERSLYAAAIALRADHLSVARCATSAQLTVRSAHKRD